MTSNSRQSRAIFLAVFPYLATIMLLTLRKVAATKGCERQPLNGVRENIDMTRLLYGGIKCDKRRPGESGGLAETS